MDPVLASKVDSIRLTLQAIETQVVTAPLPAGALLLASLARLSTAVVSAMPEAH